MKRNTIDCIVYACMFIVLYINWTDFPKPVAPCEVRGTLIKIGVG